MHRLCSGSNQKNQTKRKPFYPSTSTAVRPSYHNYGYGNKNESQQPFFGPGPSCIQRTAELPRQEINKIINSFEVSSKEFIPYLKEKIKTFKAGCISEHLANWKNITSDHEIFVHSKGLANRRSNTPCSASGTRTTK